MDFSSDSSEFESDTERHCQNEIIDNSNLAEKKTNIKQIIHQNFQHSIIDNEYLSDIFQTNNHLCMIRQTNHNVITLSLCFLERIHLIELNDYEEAYFVKKLKKSSATALKKSKSEHLPVKEKLNTFEHILKLRIRGFTFFLKIFYYRNREKMSINVEMFDTYYLLLDNPIVEKFMDCLSDSVRRLYIYGQRSGFFELCLCQSKKEEISTILITAIKILLSDNRLCVLLYQYNKELKEFITPDMLYLLKDVLSVYSKKKAIYQKAINTIHSYMYCMISRIV